MKMPDKDPEIIPSAGTPEQSTSSNVFTGTQRKALINEILHEMRKDSVKQEVLTEVEKADRVKLISKFFQHPAVLLVIGFTVTGLIGGWLANRWQSQEWDRQRKIQEQEWENQQLRMLDFNSIALKSKLIDDITKSIGERNAAALGIITPLLLYKISDQKLMKEEEEPKKNWQRVDYDWRVNSQILQLKIETLIKSPSASEIFQEIVDNEKTIGAQITSIEADLSKYRRDREYLAGVISNIKDTGPALKHLVTVIAEEARKDAQSKQP